MSTHYLEAVTATFMTESWSSQVTLIAIYAPLIYTAPYIMFLMRADPLRGQVGGVWDMEIKTFLGPVKWHRGVRRVPFGAQKSPDFQGPTQKLLV